MGTRSLVLCVVASCTLLSTTTAQADPVLALHASAATTGPNGSATFSASGGVPPYGFQLSDNQSGGAVDATSGAYVAGPWGEAVDTVEVTDAVGSTAQLSISVGAMLTVTPATSFTAPRGSVGFSADGGSAPYTWSIRDNQSGGTIDRASGSYLAGPGGDVVDTIAVTDAAGTVVTASVTVGAGVSVLPARALVAPREPIAFSAAGGAGNFVFALAQNGSGGHIDAATGDYVAGPLGGATDVVRVTDSDGNSATVRVGLGAGLTIAPATVSVDPLGSVQLGASGGFPFGYVFSLAVNASGGSIDAASGAYLAGATVGVDTAQVTDALGNVATVSISVGSAFAIGPTSPSLPPRGSVTFSATGGSGQGVTWALATNASGASIDATSGVYTAGATGNVTDVVSATDSAGNRAQLGVAVGGGVIITPANTTVQSGGAMTFTVSGGSGTGYVWSLAGDASGATLQAASGAYTAGAGTGTDTIAVVDSLGNAATATVTVMPSSSTLSLRGMLPSGARPPAASPGLTTSPTAQGGCAMVGGAGDDDARSLLGLLCLALLLSRRLARAR